MKNALSINGGGIRGIIPSSVLASLEQQTGRLTRDLFSYVAGTSTGALLAAGVAAGIPAAELLSVYTTRSREIFTPTGVLAGAKRIAEGFMYDP
ncbi:MAG: patatin-like phospholipase family protein [Ignavibacteriota bacterium]